MANSEHKFPTIDPVEMVDEHCDALFRFAMSRVHDASLAEDLVQDTFLAAIKCPGFTGRSSVRTWLTGILKNKISDHFRSVCRIPATVEEEMFDENGHWREEASPIAWEPSPETALTANELRHVIGQALDHIPDRLRKIFLLREVSGLARQEICRLMNLTDSNFWTSMHRARLALRSEVERRWLAPRPTPSDTVAVGRTFAAAHVAQ